MDERHGWRAMVEGNGFSDGSAKIARARHLDW
jgi:hypothetical protein